MLISFIITNYNIPVPLLRECIESIVSLNLNYEEREIILIDDGSETSPLEELGELATQIIYKRQENQGLSAARNTGIEMASGQYIQFVDGDDCLIADGYNIVIEQIRKSSFDIVMFALSNRNKAEKGLTRRLKLFFSTYADLFLKQHNLRSSACGYVFSKKILGDLRFTKGIYHEDEEFTPLLFLRANFIAHTGIKAYFYRTREESITTKQTPEHLDKRLHDLQGIIIRLRDVQSRHKRGQFLQRRVNQLQMDYMYNVMRIADSFDKAENKYNELRHLMLTAIPLHLYTPKYLLFSVLCRFKPGRKLLFKFISK